MINKKAVIESDFSKEILYELEDISKDFSNAGNCQNLGEIFSLINSLTYFHKKLSDSSSVQKADDILLDHIYDTPSLSPPVKAELDNKNIIFVWIGRLTIREKFFIDIWRRANPEFSISLWFDSRFHCASLYSKIIKDKEFFNFTSELELLSLQNRIYQFVIDGFSKDASIDDLIIEFFNKYNESVAKILVEERRSSIEFHRSLDSSISLNDISKFEYELGQNYENLYFQEAILRGNLAAASDIFRLNILYQSGGIYVDCDTLPALDHIFLKTDKYCKKNNIRSQYLETLKSYFVTRKIRHALRATGERDAYDYEKAVNARLLYRSFRNQHPDLIRQMLADLNGIDLEKPFLGLKNIRLYKDFPLLATDRTKLNAFNNNVICANRHSRSIRIILKEMRARYRYLEKSGLISDINNGAYEIDSGGYYARLNGYRWDTFDGKHNTTIILTGPGLILEVLLGLAYKVLGLSVSVSPASVSAALSNETVGLAFKSQTLFTFEHLKSSWMNHR